MTTVMRAIIGAMPPPVTHVLYLHGFRSSPQSVKARQMADALTRLHPDVVWQCPQLPASPAAAAQLIESLVRDWPAATTAVVGSSLGGLYAAWLASRHGLRCVLLNPAVDAARDLARHIGEHPVWQSPQERLHFRAEYVEELRRLQGPPRADPARWLALICKGDEVLDWREMQMHYALATVDLIDGGDHALSDFDQRLGGVLDFLGLSPQRI